MRAPFPFPPKKNMCFLLCLVYTHGDWKRETAQDWYTRGTRRKARLEPTAVPSRVSFLGKLVLPNQGGVMTKPKTSKERERMYRQKYGVSESEARGAKTEADLKRIADRKSEKRSSGR